MAAVVRPTAHHKPTLQLGLLYLSAGRVSSPSAENRAMIRLPIKKYTALAGIYADGSADAPRHEPIETGIHHLWVGTSHNITAENVSNER
jgi:hypothetical protein